MCRSFDELAPDGAISQAYRSQEPSPAALGRPPAINPGHDPLRYCDCICDGGLQRRGRSSVPVDQLPRRQNARRDQQNALATFVHPGKGSRRNVLLKP